MPQLLQSVDQWFLVISVMILSGYFLWSIKRLFDDLKSTIKELKDTIKELFDHRNDHETRLTALETRCEMMTKQGACKS